MTVQEFVDEYVTKNNSKKMIQEHIVTKYVPITVKQEICKQIIELSSHEIVDGRKVYQSNSTLLYMLFMMSIVRLYTDIVIQSEENQITDFLHLEQCGAIEEIYGSIPEIEMERFNTILKMCQDDFMDNNRSIFSYIDRLVSSIGYILDEFEKTLTNDQLDIEG